MARRRYQLQIYDSTGGSVEYTLPNDWLSVPPEVGGQTIRPLEARAESRPWQISISDRGEQFSKLLADSGGRMVMLRRLVALQTAVEASTFANMAWGRISEIEDNVTDYRLTVDDELFIARSAEVFTDLLPIGSGSSGKYAGTRIFPPGIYGKYRKFDLLQIDSRHGQIQRTGVLSTAGNLVQIDVDSALISGWPESESQLTPNILTLLNEDIKAEPDFSNQATAGNFNTLRMRVKLDASSSGTDYEIQSFALNVGGRAASIDELQSVYNTCRFLGRHDFWLTAWVVWSTSTGPSIASAVVHAETHEPMDFLPLHIGGGEDLFATQPSTWEGYHPFSLVKDIFDELSIRYSTDIQNLIDDTDYGRHWWRVPRRANAFDWLTDHIYRPLGVVPFIGADGKVAHRSVRIPRSSDINNDITGIPLFTASNAAWPHPGWRQSEQKLVTRINYSWMNEQHIDKPAEWLSYEVDWDTYGQDALRADVVNLRRDHGRIAELGIHEIDIPLHGMHAWQDFSNFLDVRRAVDFISNDVFQRYGDGAISGTLTPLTTATALVPGSFYRVNIPTVFTPNTQGRGGTMVVQALSVSEGPAGQKMDWLWAGPALSPLATPGLTLAAATSDPKHTALLTVSSLSSGARWEARVGYSTDLMDRTGYTGTSSGLTKSLTPLAAGGSVYAQVRATAQNRISSPWSTEVTVTTSSLATPTAIATSSVTGNEAVISWAVGETAYPLELSLDLSSTCPSSGGGIVASLPRQSVEHKLTQLTLDSTHCVGVRHRDGYGGYSAFDSTSFQTTTDPTDAPAILGVDILQGIR